YRACLQAKRVDAVERIVLDVAVQVETARLTERIPAQPPADPRVVSSVQRQAESRRLMVILASESQVDIQVASQLRALAKGLIVIGGSYRPGRVCELTHASQMISEKEIATRRQSPAGIWNLD